MTHQEIRQKFLKFFESKGHKIVPSSSLLPSDPSVLFTTAGMQQFKPYFLGTADPVKDLSSKNVVTLQKCFRTSDIDEVGDVSHGTFFEMLGNFSFGGYSKKEAISFSFEFITSKEGLGLDPHRLYVTAFKGEEKVPRDDEAIVFWQEQFKTIGIDAKIGERIFLYGREKNWWEAGPGPAGPDAEMFYDLGLSHDPKFGKECHPNCDCGKFIDNGRGFERLVMVMEGKKNMYETSIFEPIMSRLPSHFDLRTKRIIADHSRAIVFLAGEGILPSNKEQGYVMRRLMRRIMALNIPHDIIDVVIDTYAEQYPELRAQRLEIMQAYKDEFDKFTKTLSGGKKELGRLEKIDASSAFKLYESFGLPYELIKDIAGSKAKDLTREAFDEEFKKHQEKSRAGAEKKFGGHGLLLDTGELKVGNEEELKKATRLHTATHLLHAALRKVLGDEVKQAGSDITAERLRFDFSFSRKLTLEEIQKIEDLANEAVKKDYVVTKEEMAYEDALKSGALAFFKLKYPPKVNVYSIGDPAKSGQVFSKELCGGPHVSHTAEIGKIKITKEETVSAGVRRIRADTASSLVILILPISAV